MLKSEEILEIAKETIQKRRKQYDSIVDFVDLVSSLWSTVLDKKITSEQVLLCMALFKVVRRISSTTKEEKKDSLVDLIGYSALIADLDLDLSEPFPAKPKSY